MISIKNEREIEVMRKACKITAAARALAGEMVRPGVTTKEIDKAVYDFIVSQGATPSFLHYCGYPASVCISVNNTVIHGIPDSRVLKEGDIVSIDIPNCRIEVQVDDATLAARKAKWVCPEPRVKTGYLARYAKMVQSASKGAVLD